MAPSSLAKQGSAQREYAPVNCAKSSKDGIKVAYQVAIARSLTRWEWGINGLHSRTALLWAAERGNEAVVKWLLHAGAKVNAQGGWYGNTMQAASYGGHEKVVQILVDAGADINARGGLYGNALQAASAGGHEKVVQLLLRHGAKDA